MTQSEAVIIVRTGGRTLTGLVAEHVSNRSHPGEEVRVPLHLEARWPRDHRLLGQLQREAERMGVRMTFYLYRHDGWVTVSGRWDRLARFMHRWSYLTGQR